MQLKQLIKELIYTNDCVTIPGFGSFIANKFPSIYNKEESKFYPPSRRITFNSKIKNNDGLLANFISTKSKISYDEALKKIHTEVIKWNRIIRKEPLVIKDLGELIFSKDENLVFKPDLDSNHYLESFGLSPIYVNKIESKINFRIKKITDAKSLKSFKISLIERLKKINCPEEIISEILGLKKRSIFYKNEISIEMKYSWLNQIIE